MQSFRRIIAHWLPLAVVIPILCGLSYLLSQQVLRGSADDPQIQMAQDAAVAITQGASPASLTPASKVEMSQSLAPFLVFYDDQGNPLSSSAVLHGEAPSLPAGVLEYARKHGENRLTWQPEPGVRIASVTVHYAGAAPGFVLAGRSLREVELRERNISRLAGAAMLAALFFSFVAVVFSELALVPRRPVQP
jgi:hypothetical protein